MSSNDIERKSTKIRRRRPETASTEESANTEGLVAAAPTLPTPAVVAAPAEPPVSTTHSEPDVAPKKPAIVSRPSKTKAEPKTESLEDLQNAPIFEPEPEDDDFGSMFEDDYSSTERLQADLEVGDQVNARVVAVSRDHAFLDLGVKSEGSISLRELEDDEGNHSIKEGDWLEAYVVRLQPSVELSLSMGGSARDMEALEQAHSAGIPVDGKVTGVNKGGFEVTIAGKRAFCPMSQMDHRYVSDPSVFVGQSYRFRITKISGPKDIVVSRRAILDEEHKKRAEERRGTIEEGSVVGGTVTRVTDFGAFVDLGGIEGLVHISEISWERVEDASTVLEAGKKVRVKILKIDEDEGRMSLSIKQAARDPWFDSVQRYSEGETCTGTVTRIADFGAFVSLEEGLEGLVHISECAWRKVNQVSEVVQVGDRVSVRVLNVDPDRKRLALSLRQAQDNPWDATKGTMSVGAVVEGKVEKIANFGVFVELTEGVTGLLPLSETDTPHGTDLKRAFPVGSTVKVAIMEIDHGRQRISLSRAALAEIEERKNIAEYMNQPQDPGPSNEEGLGSLGLLLKEKLASLNKK